MKGKIESFSRETLSGCVYLPPDMSRREAGYSTVYINGGSETDSLLSEIIEEIEPWFAQRCEPFLLVGIISKNCNRDFTPWEAPALSKQQSPFEGGAKQYLSCLTDELMPELEKKYPIDRQRNTLLGYSLGGLVSLYALYHTSAFYQVASLSGSLWFEGWIDFMRCHCPRRTDAKVYLSLGSTEARSKNSRLAQVDVCTAQTKSLLQQQLWEGRVTFEWNRGGHFSGIPRRFIRALEWLKK